MQDSTTNSGPSLSPKPQNHFNSKNPWLWAGVGLAVVVILAGAVFLIVRKDAKEASNSGHTPSSSPADNAFLQQYGQGCQERDITFTSAPMKLEELAFIRPLGAVSDGHVTPTDHVYIGGPNPNAADNTYAVLMPADGTVTQVSAMPAQYIGDRQDQQVAQEDHRIVISHSCRYFSIYIHIHKLSDALKEKVGNLQPNESKQLQLELKAGDVVGYIGGSTFDWTPIDTSVTLPGFVTPSLYEGESWKVHTVSPFDLYTGTLKTELEAKSLRTAEPVGGKIDYDEPDKLTGNWFREGTGGYSGSNQNNEGRYWDGHLSVVPDYINPNYTIISVGNWNGKAQQFVVVGTSGTPTGFSPSSVTEASGLVKVELKRYNYTTAGGGHWNGSSLVHGLYPAAQGAVEGTIAFQVLPGEKLKVEKFVDKSAAQVTEFTSAAQMYER